MFRISVSYDTRKIINWVSSDYGGIGGYASCGFDSLKYLIKSRSKRPIDTRCVDLRCSRFIDRIAILLCLTGNRGKVTKYRDADERRCESGIVAIARSNPLQTEPKGSMEGRIPISSISCENYDPNPIKIRVT